MALSFDPQALPVIGTDEHLPPVPAERLAPDALRARFAALPAFPAARAGVGIVRRAFP